MSNLASTLLDWYARDGRDLPWRKTQSPYAIWISEVMLQQTRVDTVIPYYERWISRFPDLRSLAAAEVDEVLRLWEGLGYYQRAHNLHRAAAILQEQGGTFPDSVDELRALPGIGPYTANAIAAIAFDRPVIALDGNLRRVLARLFAHDRDPKTPQAGRSLKKRALELLPAEKSAEFNQALMDLGAEICAPRTPKCEICPLQAYCEGYRAGRQNELPIQKPKGEIPHHVFVAGVVWENGEVVIARRPTGGLLGGMWEFPNGQCDPAETLESCLRKTLDELMGFELHLGDRLGTFKHTYSHFKSTVHVIECRLLGTGRLMKEADQFRWVSIENLPTFPMGKVDRAIAQAIDGNYSSSHHENAL